jgi:hypothetical protein
MNNNFVIISPLCNDATITAHFKKNGGCPIYIQPIFKIYNRNREIRENYVFDISTGRPRIVFMLKADSGNVAKGHNVKEISVSFSIPNILFRCTKNTIKLIDLLPT